MPSRAELSGLVERVKAATGPDRELDRDLTAYFHPDEPLQWPDMYKATAEHWRKRRVERLTGSLDAAVALCHRVLPRWYGSVDIGADHTEYHARLHLGRIVASRHGVGAAPALALLAAILEALSQSEPT